MLAYLQVMHPVLTLGLPVRVRRTVGAGESPISVLDEDGDTSTRGALINGEI